MENLNKKHSEVFGVEPRVIGINWDRPDVIDKGVKDAIARGVAPYDELEMLTRKERTDFLAGNLIF